MSPITGLSDLKDIDDYELNKMLTRNTQEQNRIIMNEVLPDTKFIAVFGSSHSFGSCRKDKAFMLDDNQVWIDNLAQQMGIPVINCSLPGSSNDQLIDMITTFLELPRCKKYCQHIIMEARFCESATDISKDRAHKSLFPDNIYDEELWQEKFNLNEELLISKHFVKKLFHDNLSNRKVVNAQGWHFNSEMPDDQRTGRIISHPITLTTRLLQRFAWMGNPDRQRDQIIGALENMGAHNADITLTPEMEAWVQEFMQFGNLKRKYEIKSLKHWMHDYKQLKVAGKLINANGIGFNWFCWDAKTTIDSKREVSKIDSKHQRNGQDALNDIITEAFERSDPESVKYEIKSLNKGAVVHYLEDTGDLPPSCDCGHQNEVMHKWVSQNIYKFIKDKIV